jgi:hypothetical protein
MLRVISLVKIHEHMIITRLHDNNPYAPEYRSAATRVSSSTLRLNHEAPVDGTAVAEIDDGKAAMLNTKYE